METRPRRQQTTEKIGAPLELGIGRVHTLAVRADREQRTVSQLVRLLLRNVFQHAA
jgi:hypothetical protein